MLIFLLYNKSSVVAEMGDRLATINIGRREGAAVPIFGGGRAGPHQTQCGLGRDLPPYQVASWSSSHFVTIDMGWKVGRGAVPLSRGAESPFNTMSPGPRPTTVPNGIFIHLAVWPQQTWAENWGCAPLGGAGYPCNTMSPGPTSTSLSSGIVIHPAVWPQQTRAENGGWGWCAPF